MRNAAPYCCWRSHPHRSTLSHQTAHPCLDEIKDFVRQKTVTPVIGWLCDQVVGLQLTNEVAQKFFVEVFRQIIWNTNDNYVMTHLQPFSLLPSSVIFSSVYTSLNLHICLFGILVVLRSRQVIQTQSDLVDLQTRDRCTGQDLLPVSWHLMTHTHTQWKKEQKQSNKDILCWSLL